MAYVRKMYKKSGEIFTQPDGQVSQTWDAEAVNEAGSIMKITGKSVYSAMFTLDQAEIQIQSDVDSAVGEL